MTFFRYSALTFNAHRIHYDADYCRNIEGYPGVVIHGPLIATLLLDLCVRHGRTVGRFTYRARAPLFLPHPFTTNGDSAGTTTRLRAAGHDGRIAMEAEARPACTLQRTRYLPSRRLAHADRPSCATLTR